MRTFVIAAVLAVVAVNASLATKETKSKRIRGGIKVTSGQIKHQVSVQVNNKNHCGGAIIGDQYILTAAHCVLDERGRFRPNMYQVVAGSTDLTTNEGVRLNVEKIYAHKKYSSQDKAKDIAVLKLHRGLGLGSNPHVEKVNLPSSKEVSHVGHVGTVSGFGLSHVEVRTNPKTGKREEFNRHTDRKLRYAHVNIISNTDCATMNYYQKIGQTHICGQAVQREGELTGVCAGDSGGPLVRGNTIIGVVSSSPVGCMEHKYATVYTKVSPFVDFINKAMKGTKTSDMLVHEMHVGESSSGSQRPG